jgi:hypothetical protein
MALALSDNLEAREDFDEQDLLGPFINCWQAGRRELRTTTAGGGTTSVRCGRRRGFSRRILMEAAASKRVAAVTDNVTMEIFLAVKCF